MMKKKFAILSILAIIAIHANAQYYPLFSQYLSNGMLLNPAYTGSRDVLSINAMHRTQMVGFKGAPSYQSFTAHMPLKNENVGLGFMALNEKAGPIQNTHIYTTYAYRVAAGSGKLAFGLKAGLNYGNYSWSNLYTNESGDPAFENNNTTLLLPNLGAGMYYYSNTFFTGLSIPYFLSYKEKATHDGFEVFHDINNYNFLFTAGFLLNVSPNFRIKPSTLLKYNMTAKEQFDLNLNIITLNDMLSFGALYRTGEAMAGIVEVQLNHQLRIGCTYEYSTPSANTYNYYSYEFSVRYEFQYKIKAANPRLF